MKTKKRKRGISRIRQPPSTIYHLPSTVYHLPCIPHPASCILLHVPTSLHEIQSRIASACARAGRQTSEVMLVGASKTVESARLRPFIDAGLLDLGENYIQEGIAKRAALADYRALHWHFIGALQSNKARQAVEHFDLIHSVDRPSLARALDSAARAVGKVQDILLQVNLGGEATKAGCSLGGLDELANLCASLANLRVRGLMALPPPGDPEASRSYFRQLREARDSLKARFSIGNAADELSMGMSGDYEVAIEEGATLVRIGTALFGERLSYL